MKKSLIILGSIVVIGGLSWGGLHWFSSGFGGGKSEQHIPDTLEINDVSIWKTYTNSQYGFEVKVE